MTGVHCFICVTCGVQFAPTTAPPEHCPICEDERQYVGWSGQQWTTLDALREEHRNEVRDDLGLVGMATKPSFAIGQRALLVRAPHGNVLWDCIPLIDDATVKEVRTALRVRSHFEVPIPRPRTASAVRAHPAYPGLRERIWRDMRGDLQ